MKTELLHADGTTSPLDCIRSTKIGEGSYGVVKKCEDDNKAIKETNESLEREFNFIDKTKGKESSSWIQMYKIIYVDQNKIGMDLIHKTIEDLKIKKDNLIFFADNLIKSMKEFHQQSEFTHNDIKPANIGVVGKPLQSKFIDLGSAIHIDEKMDNSVGKTILFDPVSDLDMDQHTNRVKSDNWALGCTIYETVCRVLNPNMKYDDRHLFFASHLSNPYMSIMLISNMTPCNLKFILGLSDTYDDDKFDYEKFLLPKQQHFNRHPLGQKIYELMFPCFEEDKKSKKCLQSQAVIISLTKKPKVNNFMIDEDKENISKKKASNAKLVDRVMLKEFKQMKKSLPKNYKLGQHLMNKVLQGGNNSKISPEALKLSYASIQAVKNL